MAILILVLIGALSLLALALLVHHERRVRKALPSDKLEEELAATGELVSKMEDKNNKMRKLRNLLHERSRLEKELKQYDNDPTSEASKNR